MTTFSVQFTQNDLTATAEFLRRTTLKGEEVPAFNGVMEALKNAVRSEIAVEKSKAKTKKR